MSYGDDSQYGDRKANYGDEGEGGRRTTYGEEGGYGQQQSSGYGQQQSSGYGAEDGGYSQPKKDSDGDGIPDEFEKSQYNREDVENLKDRTDIDDEEKEHRRKVLMAEVAGGVVGAGVLGIAGYAAYQHFNKDDDEKAATGEEGGRLNEDGSSGYGERKEGYGEGEEGYGARRSGYGEGEAEEKPEKKGWF